MPAIFRLQAYTRAPRLELLSLAHDAALGAGASVMDFQQFSNASVCLTLEIPLPRLGELHTALARLPLVLSPDLDAFLAPYQADPSPAPATPLHGTLALSFLHQEPDLRLSIPAVPG